MARARTSGGKRAKAADLAGVEDPRAPLDGGAFLKAAQPVLKQLGQDLLERAQGSAAVTEALEARHRAERAARRTAEDFPGWRRQLVDQVAAAWLLSCVFVRTLEDRGLVGHARIAGKGALDSQRLFFELGPNLTERDYLLFVFRELTRLPAARDLFDARHNPVWMLAPSADGAKALLALFRQPSAEAPAFRFGQEDTRFLGDLYQDLNEEVQKRFALLQTPRFVESFILDRTLERAIEKFGLDEATVIDPTCGSGHFLLGSFERLFDHRLRKEPGIGERQAAKKALEAVAGADINPYAVAIARFRLTLAFLEKAGFKRLKGAPELPLKVVVADSLLYKMGVGQLGFAERQGESVSAWEGEQFALEDEEAAKEVLGKRYAAVVGNPPFFTVKDPVLRERYREDYISASGQYPLGAPFTERFFQLAIPSGFVGLINANSFMRREFGKKLIEQCLARVNLDFIANTSGAFIPGPGTPTILLFGTSEAPKGMDVLAVLAKRGEPTTPADPAQGLVWRSIADHWDEVGFENDFISVARVPRSTLAKHPWSLGGGGAAELKEYLEEQSTKRLCDVVESSGFASFTGLDGAFVISHVTARCSDVEPELLRPVVVGESLRDWMCTTEDVAVTPYDLKSNVPLALDVNAKWARFLWPFRACAEGVTSFGGKTRKQGGQNWWEWYRWQRERYEGPYRIAYAEVATHNHFVLDRGGKVFKQTAPVIKLPHDAAEDDYLSLVAYLNSSLACFWMKQVCHSHTNHTEERPETGEPEKSYYAFSGTAIGKLPLPASKHRDVLAQIARHFERLSCLKAEHGPEQIAQEILRLQSPIDSQLGAAEREDAAIERAMIAQQENLDWSVYHIMGLCSVDAAQPIEFPDGITASQRVFLCPVPPPDLSEAARRTWNTRARELETRPELRLLENPTCKRRWIGIGRGSFALDAKTFRDRCIDALWALMLEAIEEAFRADVSVLSPRAALAILQQSPRRAELLTWLSGDKPPLAALAERMTAEAIPYLSPLRFTETGLEKRAAWEKTWDLQRREDAGEKLDGEIPVPPKYAREDYREGRFFNLRGKLDVPKERFISYPGCESDEDQEPVYGWAGWNHLQQAQALASLYQKRRTEEAWPRERLTPMLAGLLELIPWVKQWHNEPSDEFGGLRLGEYFETFLDGQCRELGVTREELRAWRPEVKKRGKAGGRSIKTAKTESVEAE